MNRQGKTMKQRQIWISRMKKEVFLSEVREYELIEFKKYDDLMAYVRACIACGYKVG